jgi:hypothetical protein
MNECALCNASTLSWECITPAWPYLNAGLQLNWFTERQLSSVTTNFQSETNSLYSDT